MLSSLSSSSGYGGVGASSTLQKFFTKADANNDSSLTKDELVGALGQSKTASKVGSNRLSSAVDGLIGSLDTDSSGTLSATEFSSFSSQFDYGNSSTLLQAQEASGQQRYQALYSSLDSDSSGDVSQDELSSAVSSYLSATGQSSTDGSALSSSLFSSLDSDSDGSVSQDELTSALKSAESDRPPPPPKGPPPANDSGSAGDRTSSGSSSSASGTSSATGTSATSSTGFDPLDSNQDGYVSAEERLAGTTGSSSQQSGVTSSRLSGGTLRFLMSSMNEVAA